MGWRRSAGKLGVAAVAVLGTLGAAAAQSDGNDGRPYREFKAQAATEAPAADQAAASEPSAARSRPVRTELPRGAKNIPWDEPGKLSGVPGVLENSETDLPATHARAARKAERRRARAAETAATVEDVAAPRAQPERSVRRHDPPAHALSYAPTQQDDNEPRKVPVQIIRVSPEAHPQAARADAQDATDAAAAQARAKLIEQFRAKALAEEKRRLEAEQSRDRFARRADAAAPPRSKSDPDITGAVTTAPEAEPAPQQKTSGLMQGMCRMLFFNILPGC
jgi:hypothetical protein